MALYIHNSREACCEKIKVQRLPTFYRDRAWLSYQTPYIMTPESKTRIVLRIAQLLRFRP